MPVQVSARTCECEYRWVRVHVSTGGRRVQVSASEYRWVRV